MEQDNRPVINPEEVLKFLEDGKTREQIGQHYNLSKRDVALLFKHPMLKGKKTRIAPGFVFATPSEEISNRDTNANAAGDEQDDAGVSSESDDVEDVTSDDSNEVSSQWNNN